MEVKVMWFVPPALVLAAQGLGLPGADAISATRTQGSDEQFDTLVAGGCDCVVTAMDNVFAWNRRPGPRDFCILAQLERTTPLVLMGRAGLNHPTHLRGARVLVDASGNGFVVVLRAMLQAAGLRSADYQLVEAGGVRQRLDALLAGRGDATLLGPPFEALAGAAGYSVIARVQDQYPNFPGQGLIVSRSALPRFRAQLGEWLATLKDTCRQAAVAPAAAKDALVRAAGVDVDGAAAMFSLLPTTLIPDRPGFDLLVSMRRELKLPGAQDSYDGLVNPALL